MNNKKILQIKNLRVVYKSLLEEVEAVAGIDLDLYAGEALAIVGESGSGKSTVAYSLMGLHDSKRVNVEGEILFNGQNILNNSTSQWQDLRGKDISMIFQNPMSSLTPYLTIGKQVMEPILRHTSKSVDTAKKDAIDLLNEVEISDVETSFDSYPHQLSGGMRQRVVIAIALACRPSLVIADEPTTALDVTVQAQILELIQSLQEEMGLSVMMITHDLGVIAETCDDVVVMYAGRVAEKGNTQRIFENPQHLYTLGLLNSIPKLGTPRKQRLNTIDGYVPGLDEMPVGARFAPRSQHPRVAEYLASEDFKTVKPGLVEVEPGHWVEDCAYVRAF